MRRGSQLDLLDQSHGWLLGLKVSGHHNWISISAVALPELGIAYEVLTLSLNDVHLRVLISSQEFPASQGLELC